MENFNYDDCVRKYSSTFVRIILSDTKVETVKNFVKKVIQEKMNESHHVVDSGMEEKRWTTGFLGESAVEQFFDNEFIVFSTVANTKSMFFAILHKVPSISIYKGVSFSPKIPPYSNSLLKYLIS